jgi:hypothetical protein
LREGDFLSFARETETISGTVGEPQVYNKLITSFSSGKYPERMICRT